MNNIIVFGASGQLGHSIRAVIGELDYAFVHFIEKSNANIADPESLSVIFEKYKPYYCINCAAYTAVDNAEDHEADALSVNAQGAENVSRICHQYDCTLIHISTDFVFEGNKATPLTELDDTNPVNVYGATKLAGERAVQLTAAKYFIIRTSWLYSEFCANFLKTMLKLGNERPELKIIADQIGTPTYAADLAYCIFSIIEQETRSYGIYHFSNEGAASWYDFAKAIFDISKKDVKVLPVKTEEYVTKARRPAYSLLDKGKIKQELGLNIPYWRDSLELCISKLQNH